jgi:uncharacterized coiled-coil protein SlyX
MPRCDMSDLDQRIGALEDELKHRDKRITELKSELDEARALIADMEEQVQECRENRHFSREKDQR